MAGVSKCEQTQTYTDKPTQNFLACRTESAKKTRQQKLIQPEVIAAVFNIGRSRGAGGSSEGGAWWGEDKAKHRASDQQGCGN